MITILTINAGSSSLKFSVWIKSRRVMVGQIEQIGGRARLILGRSVTTVVAPSMAAAMKVVQTILAKRGLPPNVVGHRIVHGGVRFSQPTKLIRAAIQYLQSIAHLAPLHLPVNLVAVRLAQRAWPQSQHWGVFDTAIYHELPARAQQYALPPAVSKKYQIRKYGFHGTSHAWAFEQTAKRLRQRLSQMNAITVHLGAGSSLTMWHQGRPVDTSMGFTPLAGVPMMTRAGDLDPAIPLFLQTHAGWSAQRVTTLLNRQSGLFGLTGLQDMRDILQAAGHAVAGWPRRRWSPTQRQRARQGLAIYLYGIQKYLSSYVGLTPHLGAIVFTGGIGQNRDVQRLLLQNLVRPSDVRILTIPADEEQAIAAAVARMI